MKLGAKLDGNLKTIPKNDSDAMVWNERRRPGQQDNRPRSRRPSSPRSQSSGSCGRAGTSRKDVFIGFVAFEKHGARRSTSTCKSIHHLYHDNYVEANTLDEAAKSIELLSQDRSKPRRVSSGTRLFVIGSHKSHIAHRKQPTFAIAMCPSSSPTILHSMPSIQDDARADDDSVNTKKSSNQTLSSASSFATIDSTNLVDLNNHAARILQAEGLLVSSTGGSEKTTMTLSKKQSRRMRTSGKQRASDSLAFSPDNFFAAPTMSDNEVGNATNRSPTRTSGERKIGSPTSVIPAVNSVARPSTLKASNIIRPSKTLVSIEEQYSQSLDGSDDSSNDIREKFSPSISVEDESKSLATEFAKSHAKSPLDRLHDLINGSFCVSKETLINQIQNQCTEENLVDDIWEESVIDDVVDALVEEDSDYDDDTCSGTFATYDDEDTYASSLHSSQGRLRRGRSLTARHGYNSDGESVSPRVSRSRSTLDSSGTSNRRTKSRRYPDADDASGEDITVAESVLSQDHSTWKSMTNAATTGEEDASNEGFKSSTKAVLESSKYPRESSAAEGYFKVRSDGERVLL